jgi:hypothetical protein
MHRRMLFASLVAALCVCAVSARAQAQQALATRTWVSGTGDDTAVCSRSAPCLTFAGAIAKTAPGGEIDALDPGGFGTVAITKSITIDGGGGIVASALAGASTAGPAIQINAAANDRVVLRNLRLTGINTTSSAPGTNGIAFNSGLSLAVENCVIQNFNSYGINFQPNIRAVLTVTDTIVEGSGTFGSTFGGGIIAATPAGSGGLNRVTIKNTTVSTSVSGITAGANTKMDLDHVLIAEGGVGGAGDYGLIANGSSTEIQVSFSTVSGNQFGGVHATGSSTIRFMGSSITNNNTNGILIDPGSQVLPVGTNLVAGNQGMTAFS